jgi:signal peptidase I
MAMKTIISIVLLIGAWLLFAPQSLGGRTGFIVINGNSMEPLYHRGDLVITLMADDYAVGDIVTYLHPDIGIVIHRMLERNGERWRLQGDNNSFIDPYEPLPSEVTGRAWAHVPRAGNWLVALRNVWYIPATLLGGGITMAMINSGNTPHRRQRRSSVKQFELDLRLAVVTLYAVCTLAAALLAGYAFTRPLSTEVSTPRQFSHQGQFSYRASAPAGIYDTPEARSGDPIFTRVSNEIEIQFKYQFISDTESAVSGSAALQAELSSSNGWRHSFSLVEPQAFSGNTVNLSGTIDLVALRTLIEQIAKQTGMSTQQHQLTVLPQVDITGKLGDTALTSNFSPKLSFKVDPNPSAAGALPHSVLKAEQIALLWLKLEVAQARMIGLWAAATLLIATLLLGLPLLRLWQQSERSRIQLRYGALLVDGTATEAPNQVISVDSIAALTRLAERHATLIVRDEHGASLRYLVIDGVTAYVYAPASPDVPPCDPAPTVEPVQAHRSR